MREKKHTHTHAGWALSPECLQKNDYDYFAQEGKLFPRINEGHCSETSISWRKSQDRKGLSIYFTDRSQVLMAQLVTQAVL